MQDIIYKYVSDISIFRVRKAHKPVLSDTNNSAYPEFTVKSTVKNIILAASLVDEICNIDCYRL
jgi:hypothetical protein